MAWQWFRGVSVMIQGGSMVVWGWLSLGLGWLGDDPGVAWQWSRVARWWFEGCSMMVRGWLGGSLGVAW